MVFKSIYEVRMIPSIERVHMATLKLDYLGLLPSAHTYENLNLK